MYLNPNNLYEYANEMSLGDEVQVDLMDTMDDGKNIWDDYLEEKFILLMGEEVRQGNRTNATFNNVGWRKIMEGMMVETGKTYTIKQLRNKFNQLRAIHKDFKKLLSEMGVGYNAESGMIVMEDERWVRFLNVGKKFARRVVIKHFDKLSTIFGDTHATGSQVRPFTRSHPTSHVPTNMSHINSLDDTINEEGNDVQGKERTPSLEP
ncbi:uncharacterized protein LOC132301660 [Cornus florida]|uniref:uncharacterized protein LOC132301660 n=1 Tax=Cornus florida TaxID=4283 RepID=UPI00289C0EE4|nr:uncharacterized protein LOC132301660 [Cornus florida]